MRFFETRRVGEIISRMNDAAKIREAIGGVALTAVVDTVMILISLAVLWSYDMPLAMLATAFVPLLMITVAVYHPAIQRRSRDTMEYEAQLSAHLVEDVSGVETIKAFSLENTRSADGEIRLLRLAQSVFSIQKLGICVGGMGTLLTGTAGVMVLWYGGHRVMENALTIGQLMFFYTMLAYMLTPLERLASVNLQLQDALVAIDRLFQILDVEPEPVGNQHQAQLAGVRHQIELQDVSFQYGCREKVLQNITMSIPAGKTVAVVGESGSGKSTLLKLLMRFYQPTQGSIQIDGLDLRDFQLESLRSRIGLVSQEPFIFNGTIRDNIALGRDGASMDEIVEVTRIAGLESFINGLPDRFETVIGERGANLSGGQRQRMAIARALLQKPEIIIFDEATSHLDVATERTIQSSLNASLAGKTVVVVAHRLSTIQNADIIYVMQNGQIAERGSHRQLMAADGGYAALWRTQSGDHAAMRSTPVESDIETFPQINNGHLRHPITSLHGSESCATTRC